MRHKLRLPSDTIRGLYRWISKGKCLLTHKEIKKYHGAYSHLDCGGSRTLELGSCQLCTQAFQFLRWDAAHFVAPGKIESKRTRKRNGRNNRNSQVQLDQVCKVRQQQYLSPKLSLKVHRRTHVCAPNLPAAFGLGRVFVKLVVLLVVTNSFFRTSPRLMLTRLSQIASTK